MQPRVDYMKSAYGVVEAMLGLERYLHQCGLETRLLDLVKLRASQINGCSFCIRHHTSDARKYGGHDRSNHA